MNFRPKFTLCTLCLGYECTLLDPFENNELDFKLPDLIQELLQFEVSNGGCIPWMVCEICLRKLKGFLNFKTNAIKCKTFLECMLFRRKEHFDHTSKDELMEDDCSSTDGVNSHLSCDGEDEEFRLYLESEGEGNDSDPQGVSELGCCDLGVNQLVDVESVEKDCILVDQLERSPPVEIVIDDQFENSSDPEKDDHERGLRCGEDVPTVVPKKVPGRRRGRRTLMMDHSTAETGSRRRSMRGNSATGRSQSPSNEPPKTLYLDAVDLDGVRVVGRENGDCSRLQTKGVETRRMRRESTSGFDQGNTRVKQRSVRKGDVDASLTREEPEGNRHKRTTKERRQAAKLSASVGNLEERTKGNRRSSPRFYSSPREERKETRNKRNSVGQRKHKVLMSDEGKEALPRKRNVKRKELAQAPGREDKDRRRTVESRELRVLFEKQQEKNRERCQSYYASFSTEENRSRNRRAYVKRKKYLESLSEEKRDALRAIHNAKRRESKRRLESGINVRRHTVEPSELFTNFQKRRERKKQRSREYYASLSVGEKKARSRRNYELYKKRVAVVRKDERKGYCKRDNSELKSCL